MRRASRRSLLDRKLRFNLTGYSSRPRICSCPRSAAPNANLLLNADAKGHGFEAELKARPTRGLTMTAG